MLAYKSWFRRNRTLVGEYDTPKLHRPQLKPIHSLYVVFSSLYIILLLIPSNHWKYVLLIVIIFGMILVDILLRLGMSPNTFLICISVVTASLSLTIQNQSLLKQAEHFELSNRPFIGIINRENDIGVDIEFYKIDTNRGILPEVIYQVDIYLKNYGKLPAYVENIECVAMDMKGRKTEPFMPYPKDKEKQWHNFDLFPDNPPMSNTKYPSININAAKQIMFNDNLNKDQKFWTQDSNVILGELRKYIKPFYLIFQIKYYMIDDERNPYFYTAQFKIDTDLSAHFFKSSSKQGFKFDNNGQVTWLNKEYWLQEEENRD